MRTDLRQLASTCTGSGQLWVLKELRELNYQQVQKEDDQRRGSILLKERGKDVKMKQKQCE